MSHDTRDNLYRLPPMRNMAIPRTEDEELSELSDIGHTPTPRDKKFPIKVEHQADDKSKGEEENEDEEDDDVIYEDDDDDFFSRRLIDILSHLLSSSAV